jgi:hypothetical protein
MKLAVARGRAEVLPLMVTRLSAAYLLAGRLEEARHRAAQTVEPAAGHYREALALAEELGAPAPSCLPPLPCTAPWRCNSGYLRRRQRWHGWKGDDRGQRSLAVLSDFSPNPVTPDIAHDSLDLHCLSHVVCHLCYDGVTHKRGGHCSGNGRSDAGCGRSRRSPRSGKPHSLAHC